jgi:tRNA(Ile)-lysidine synthase
MARAGAPRLLRALDAALDAAGGPRPGEHLLVAVSGGPDSTALLAGLAELAGARRLRVTAAHVDHGLRGAESTQEGTRVAALAARLGVGFVGASVEVGHGGDLAARARRARYEALARLAAEVGATRIVTGHTRDDQAETVLLRLLRGAGRRGLGGISPARGRLLRPLLGATRADVRRFLAERDLPFLVDRTNADLRFVRNRVRRVLLPLLEAEFNPRIGGALAALAERLRDEDDFLAAAAATRLASLALSGALSTAVASEPPALARRIVRAWLMHGARPAPAASHVARVLRLAGGRGRGTIAVPGPARVLREGDRLVCRPGREATPRRFSLPVEPGLAVSHPDGGWRVQLTAPRRRAPEERRAPDAAHAIFDADELPSGLVVRSPAPGDRLRMLAGGTRKLQDVLVDAKVPREARPSVPVLAAGEDILWVPGLVRGRGAAVGPQTTRVVEGVVEGDTRFGR